MNEVNNGVAETIENNVVDEGNNIKIMLLMTMLCVCVRVWWWWWGLVLGV